MRLMRAVSLSLLTVSVTAAGWVIPAWAQTLQQNEERCGDSNPDLAIGNCTAVIQSGQVSDASLAMAFNNRGVAYGKNSKYDLAIADYNEAIRLKPDLAMAFNNRGAAQDSLGKLDFALADYNQAISLKPDYFDAFNNRGIAYGKKDQINLAIADFNEAIRIKPDYADAYSDRCYARVISGQQLDMALSDCTKVLQLTPNDENTLGIRGFVYLRLGDYSKAIADSSAALAINSKDADPLFVRGLAKQKSGNAAGGAADIAAAKAIDPKIAEKYAKYGIAPN